MTPEIATVLVIMALAVLLFITEWVRVDLVALLVLVSLAITGLVEPLEAFSGFSNMAVVTVWAVLILSGGLSKTGVANFIGRQVLRLAGSGEARLTVVIMLTAGILSGFMNNIGVAALMLPVVIRIARRTGIAPSRLLMPLAFASLLGGMSTLIGTPPNILISEALRKYDLIPFRMFDYTPVGLVVLLSGFAFMALIGRHLLPKRDIGRDFRPGNQTDLGELYDLRDRIFVISLPDDSALAGMTITESRLGSALGLNVIALIREGQRHLAPEAGRVLKIGDQLLVEGRVDRFVDFTGQRHLIVEEASLTMDQLISKSVDLAQIGLSPQASLMGMTLAEADFRTTYGLNVLAIWREGSPLRSNLQNVTLQMGDVLLVQGPRDQITALEEDPTLFVSGAEEAEDYLLHERLIAARIPKGSSLVGKSLAESRLSDAFGLTVLGIVREGSTGLVPSPEEELLADDTLLVEGKPDALETLYGLQHLEVNQLATFELSDLESETIGFSEIVLSPHTTLAGKTLREIHFREKYGLNVLSVWRAGKAYGTDLRNLELQFGDALLLYGPQEKLRILGSEPDFLVLTETSPEEQRLDKAPIALLVMGAVLIPVILGWLPIAIAAVMGVTLMILSGALTMEEAYRSIEWKAIFLIAGMLPLGIALERTGAAQIIAEAVVQILGGAGPLAVLAGIFILAAIGSQVMPNPAVAVLLAPIALSAATDLGVSPYPMMMAVAISASAAFLSPVGHPANILIMGPGGYRFKDYLKVGFPLTLVVLVVVLLFLPVIWPF